jgi:hypothetical protein
VGVQNIQSIEVEVSVPQERVLKAKEQKDKFRFTAIFDSLPEVEFDVEVKEYTTEADPLTQTYTVTFTRHTPLLLLCRFRISIIFSPV